MNKQEILADLFQRRRFDIKPGLERTTALAHCLGNPHRQFKSIHIAGTNGKGSTAAMTASILKEAGLLVGLYTSPHIRSFNERIVADGKQIDDDALVKIASSILPEADRLGATFFEITTILAFRYFADTGVDVAVIECGMGGRFDSTNIIEPDVSAVTPVAFDHSQYLGNTIEKIIFEKAGIIKPGTTTVIAPGNEEYRSIFDSVAAKKQAETIYVADIFDIPADIDPFAEEIILRFAADREAFLHIPLAFPGIHQARNTVLALCIVEEFRKSRDIEISPNFIESGLKNIRLNFPLRGRMEIVRRIPPIIVDGGHNPEAARKLAESLKARNEKFTVIFGAMSDKDIKQMLAALADSASEFIFPRLKIPRSESPEKILEIAKSLGIKEMRISETAQNAFDEEARKNKPLLITGSFYLIGEIKFAIYD